MTKFQKLQKIISIVPVLSTIFISIVTIFEFLRYKSSVKLWFLFILFLLLFVVSPYCINAFIMPDAPSIIKLIAIGIFSVNTNLLCVNLQIIACKTKGQGDGSVVPSDEPKIDPK